MNHRLYLFASSIWIILGIGHIIAEFIFRYFFNPTSNLLFKSMSTFDIRIFGFTRSVLTYMNGFSFTMGFLMLCFGILNLIVFQEAKELVLNSKKILICNGVISLIMSLLSIIYFHWPPIILFIFSGVCFFTIFFKNKKPI
jgi:hypothetical protein